MGSLVGGLFDLFSGNPTQKEQNQLGSLGGYDTGVGEGLTTAGANFEEGILSGDPTKQAQALAPEITAQQNQEQQAKNQLAEFSPRSGGTAAAAAGMDTAGRGNIISLLGGLEGSTAGAAVGQGTGLLGQASSDISQEAQLANQRRQQLTSDVTGIAEGAGQIASAFFPSNPSPDPSTASTDSPLGDTNSPGITGGIDYGPPSSGLPDNYGYGNPNDLGIFGTT